MDTTGDFRDKWKLLVTERDCRDQWRLLETMQGSAETIGDL